MRMPERAPRTDLQSQLAAVRERLNAPEPTVEHYIPPTSGTATNGLPIYNWDQAAAQLTRSGTSWTFTDGGSVAVSYAFRESASSMPNGVSSFSQFTAAQIIAAEMALQLWADVCNITLQRVGSGTDPSTAYSNNAAILFGNYAAGAPNASAFAYFPWPTAGAPGDIEGDIWVNSTLATNQTPNPRTSGLQTLAHEIGHAIGISHPANYDASDSTQPSYPASSVYWQDSRLFTMMSYFGSSDLGASLNSFAFGPQLHDIAAAQLLYGINLNTRSGDTIYGFNSNTGRVHYTITGADPFGPVFSIWDGGGNDTLDLSGYSTPSEIDLRAESFSGAGPGNTTVHGPGALAIANISIARGVVIENAIGGAGNDVIFGNQVVNTLTGNGGNDRFTGGGLNDTILGGSGIDTSIYSLASTSATWVRNTNGTWTVTAGAEGADALTGVEFLDFTDRDVFLDRAQRTFNGDGTSDILFRATSGVVASWNVTGASITSSAFLATAAPGTWTPLGTGDFNGDGRDDVIWRETSGLIYAWQMNGGTIQQAVALTGVGNEWSFLGMGDFNLDGVEDMAWRHVSGNVFTWEMNTNGGIASSGYVTGLGLDWSLAGIGDFTGDGRDDFLWRNTDGTTYVWGMNGRTIESSTPTSAQVGNNWSVIGVGDFNRDGRDDVLLQDSTGVIASWQMSGSTVLGTSFYGSADPGAWQVANVGDYNGDGRDDILFFNLNSDYVYVWLLGNGVISSAGILSGIGSEWDIIGD